MSLPQMWDITKLQPIQISSCQLSRTEHPVFHGSCDISG